MALMCFGALSCVRVWYECRCVSSGNCGSATLDYTYRLLYSYKEDFAGETSGARETIRLAPKERAASPSFLTLSLYIIHPPHTTYTVSARITASVNKFYSSAKRIK